MFEKILEKILLTNVGHFIDGIDKNNLKIGIWSGDIVIQNISVKPEVLQMLDLPVKMKYSYVSKLSVSVPWKSLGSKPVEILLEDVYIIVEPVDQSSWKSMDYKSVTKRLELMESFVQSYLAKIAEKQAEENKDGKNEDQGMVAKLTERVIDNIQVTIRNIHMRFENPLVKRKYAWGITLDEILIYTTNKNWEREFIDRTEQKNSLEPMRKMLSLKNLGIYWSSTKTELFGDLSLQLIKQNMKDLIYKDQMPHKQKLEYIITVSATCKLVQKNKKDPSAAQQPTFDISLSLKPLNLQLKKPQLEDLIRLLEFVNAFQRFKISCMKERETDMKKLTFEEKEQMKVEFIKLFDQIHRNEKAQDLIGEEKARVALGDESAVERFKTLVMSLPDEDLSAVIKGVVKEVERERRTKAIEAQKAQGEKKGGWFGWSSKKKEELQNSETLKLDANDLETIDRYIQETFGGEEEDTAAKMEQLAYQNLLHISFSLEGGNLYLSNVIGDEEEGVAFSYEGLTANIDINSKGKCINVALRDYGLYLRTRYAGTTTYTDTPVVRRLNYWMPPETAGSMISLVFDQNPQGKEEGNYITLDSQAVEIVYRPVSIERIVNFFDVSTQDEALKSQALQQLEKVQEKASQAASEAVQSSVRKEIMIKFAAPVIVIPFLQNASLKSECWVINLGDLHVNTENEEKKLYERYSLELNNLRFQYFPSQALYMKVSKILIEKGDLNQLSEEEQEEYRKVFNLVEQFNIDMGIRKMIAGMENTASAKGKPRMNLDITIPSINLQLNPQMYKYLLQTGEFVSYSKEAAIELMENERAHLIAGNSKMGTVFVRETKIRDIVWNKYVCILKGTYMYFFKNPTDIRPYFAYYIRGAQVTAKDDLERPYVFMIENRYNTGHIACEDDKNRDDWMNTLIQKMKDYRTVSTNVFEVSKGSKKDPVEKKTQTEPIDYNVLSMTLKFQIKEVKLTLFHTEDRKLLDLDTQNFIINLRQQLGHTEIKCKLESVDVTDYLIDYVNPSLKKLITSVPPKKPMQPTNSNLIEIYIKTLDKNHPDYSQSKTDLEITTKFGYLYANFKPLTVKEIINFFVPYYPSASSPKKSQKVEVKEIKPKTETDTIYAQGIEHTMLKLNFELKEVSVKVIHKTTHVCMAEVALKSATLSVEMKPMSMAVTGTLGNIQLFDTTNYPNTIDSNIEYEKIQPYEMVGVGEKSENLIELSYRYFDPRNPAADNENRVYFYVDVKISSIRVNYFHQPAMRIIDYIWGQILPAVKPDRSSGGTAEARTVVSLDKEVAEANLKNLQFINIKVFAKTPIVILKPTPKSTDYIEIRLGNIMVENERIKNTTRFKNPTKPLEYVHCERYNIRLSEMGLYRIEQDSKIEMSMRVNFDMSFERPLFVEEYKLIYSEGQHIMKTKFTLQTGNILEGKMSPLIVTLMHEEFLMVMKCINFNIAYDDGMDKMFLSDYEAVVASQGQPGNPLDISLTFENFTLLALAKNHLPFAMVNLHVMKVLVSRDQYRRMEIKVTAHELNGCYFDNQGNKLIEKKMLGALDRINTFIIDEANKQGVVKEIIKMTTDYVYEISRLYASRESQKEQLSVVVQMEPNGDKIIQIIITELKAYLITSIYLQLLEFIMMDESVYPPKNIPYFDSRRSSMLYLIGQEEVKKEEKPLQVQQPQSSFTFALEIRKILVTMPSTISKIKDTPNVLALKGDLTINYTSYPPPTFQESLVDAKRKRYLKATEQCAQFNEITRISLWLNKLEIFVCEFTDLVSADNFNQVKKRNMVLPFSLMLVRKKHMVVNKDRTDLMPVTKNEINIERFILRLSYHDAMLLNNSIQFQLEQLKGSEAAESDNDKKAPVEEAKLDSSPKRKEAATVPINDKKTSVASSRYKESFDESKDDFEKSLQLKDEWEPHLDEYNMLSKGIQIVLINDAEGSLVPVLEFTMFELLISMIKLPTKFKLGGKILLTCSYFNPLPSKWEPFIEKFGLNFELALQESPRVNINISTNEEFQEINLNISDQMLAILYSTIITWKEDYIQSKSIRPGKNTIVRANSKIREEDVIDYVSPYNIVNDTGYPIEVEADSADSGLMPSRSSLTRLSTLIKQHYYIENRGSSQYLVESDIDKIFQRTLQDMLVNTNKIRIKILHPSYEICPITGLDIDKPAITGHFLEKNVEGKKVSLKNYEIFSIVKINHGKKTIILTSPFRIINKILTPCFIVLESDKQKTEIKLDKYESASIPLDFIHNGTFSIRMDIPEGTGSPKANIKDLYGLDNRMFELPTASYFILAKVSRTDPHREFYEISLLPPYQIKNCCGLELEYRFLDFKGNALENTKLKPQETLHETRMTFKQPTYLQIRLQGYSWSHRVLVHTPDPSVQVAKQIQLQDSNENTLNVLIFNPEGEVGSRKLFLYTKSCIINETPYDLFYYTVQDKRGVQIPGQIPSDEQEPFNPKITLFHEVSTMAFSRKQQREYSRPINVGTMGNTAAELISENAKTMLDLGVNMSVIRCDTHYNLITKIITITPRFILFNKTNYQIEIKRDQGVSTIMTLEKEVRTPFYWSDWSSTARDKSICIRPIQNNYPVDYWSWSNGFDIQSIGLYNYLVRAKDKNRMKFFKTTVNLDYSTIFVIFEEEKLDKVAFKVRNTCKDVNIIIYQTGTNPESGVPLKPDETIPWSWVYPNKKKEISATFSLDSVSNPQSQDYKFSFDSLNTMYKVQVPITKDRSIDILASIVVEGSTRVLKFSLPLQMRLDKGAAVLLVQEYTPPSQLEGPPNVVNLDLDISIKGLSVSIISTLTTNKQKKIKERKEIIYMLFKGIEFRMIDSTQNKTSQVRVKFLQIDNNTSYDTSFPVLWTPNKPKALLDSRSKNFFLDSIITQKVTPEVTFFEKIEFLLDASSLKIDGMFIDAIMEVVNNFNNIFTAYPYTKRRGTIAESLYYNLEDAKKLDNPEYFSSKFDWLHTELSELAGGNLYIKKLVLNPLFFNISFQLKKKDAAEDTNFLINLITSVVGTALANLDNAPLTLTGIMLDNVFDSKEAIIKKIIDKYKDEVTKSIPKLLGSLDIVGNPVGLFINISSGVVDLVEKPFQGFLQGPLEGGKGIMIGASSLVKNTVSGTFNSIGKMTGSLASGLSNLTMDDEYMEQREKAKVKRPRHVGEGVIQGVNSIFKGVGDGVTGIFTKPIEGATKEGFKGFFKGAIQGVTGLVVKPVTGILDAASNTAEGIKNTATASDQKPNDNRMRYPRAFYGKDKFYRTYADTDAEILWLLHFSESPIYKKVSILSSYEVFHEEGEKDNFHILLISLEAIIWWSVKKEEIKWAIDTTNIQKVDQVNNCIIIQLRRATELFKEKTIAIKNCDSVQNMFIYKKLVELVNYLKQQ